MNVSILFATCNRDTILKKTLDSFTQLDSSGLDWEVIVIDNAVKTSTKRLVENYTSLPIHYLEQAKPGKNHALNTGLPKAKGELLVFTDDDILADPNWIQELVKGSANWPDYDLFGGKILPDYPDQKPDPRIDFNHTMISPAYVISNREIPEGEIRVGLIWGPNMAIRKRVFDAGLSFNPDIGPNGKNYVMGSESEFLYRAAEQGYQGIYLPNAIVHHQIRPEQLTLSWLTGRAFRQGKGSVAIENTTGKEKNYKMLWNAPRFLYKKTFIALFLNYLNVLTGNKKKRFHYLLFYHFYKGQISQYKTLWKK